MKEHYIQAPYEQHSVTLIKCKAKRNKPASVYDVPTIYRKDPKAKVRDWLNRTKDDIKFIIRRIKNDY